MANSAFNARFRVVDNNSSNQNAPERNLIIDFDKENAKKAAMWLMQEVDKVDENNTTQEINQPPAEQNTENQPNVENNEKPVVGKLHIGGKTFDVTFQELDMIARTMNLAKDTVNRKYKMGMMR